MEPLSSYKLSKSAELQSNNNNHAHTHIHTRMGNGLFSRTTWVGRYQKDKPFWILLKQEMMEWQWHQLNHMRIICTSLQTDNDACTSSLHIFYRPDALPAAQPTASKHWRHNQTTTEKIKCHGESIEILSLSDTAKTTNCKQCKGNALKNMYMYGILKSYKCIKNHNEWLWTYFCSKCLCSS